MEKKLWFKNKRYGWGWTPATWEGWLAILIYFACFIPIVNNYLTLSDENSTNEAAVIRDIALLLFITAVLLVVSYYKGEKPSWHWGDK
jgi:hypothetical protein